MNFDRTNPTLFFECFIYRYRNVYFDFRVACMSNLNHRGLCTCRTVFKNNQALPIKKYIVVAFSHPRGICNMCICDSQFILKKTTTILYSTFRYIQCVAVTDGGPSLIRVLRFYNMNNFKL